MSPAREPSRADAPASRWRTLSQVSPRRAMLLSGLGCVAGLVMAGAALFTARGTTTLVVPPDAIAMVNQQPISRLDFAAQLRVLALDPRTASRADKRRIAEDMIREELFVQRGKELDVALVDPEVRSAMVRAVEAQAAANGLTNTPGEAELRAYFDSHRSRYASEGTMRLRDLAFPSERAPAARAALLAGTPIPAVLDRQAGRDTGRLDGEEFYFAARIHLGPALFAVAQGLADGQVSSPFAAADGDHLLVMIANHPPRPATFEAARKQITSDFQTDLMARYQAQETAFLRRRANVLLAEDVR